MFQAVSSLKVKPQTSFEAVHFLLLFLRFWGKYLLLIQELWEVDSDRPRTLEGQKPTRDKGENSRVLQESQGLWFPYPNPSPGSERRNLGA